MDQHSAFVLVPFHSLAYFPAAMNGAPFDAGEAGGGPSAGSCGKVGYVAEHRGMVGPNRTAATTVSRFVFPRLPFCNDATLGPPLGTDFGQSSSVSCVLGRGSGFARRTKIGLSRRHSLRRSRGKREMGDLEGEQTPGSCPGALIG